MFSFFHADDYYLLSLGAALAAAGYHYRVDFMSITVCVGSLADFRIVQSIGQNYRLKTSTPVK